jgi:transposase
MEDSLDRLATFRTLKEKVRGSTDHLLVGIDVAKDRHHSFFGTPQGKVLRKRFVFDNTRAGIDQLLTLADDLQTRHGLTQRVFGLEPTGIYHKPLLEDLLRRGETTVLVSNVGVAINRELLVGGW